MEPQRLDRLLSSNSSLHPLELSWLQQDIQSREDVIRNLRLQLDTLESECETRKALLSPLRRAVLPPELLGEIFCETLEASEIEETFEVVKICLVCRAWRDVALATPRLWVAVRVWLDELVDFKKVKTWLSRSCTLPKRLYIDGEDNCTGSPVECPMTMPGLAGMLAEGPLLELSLVCTSPQCCHSLFKNTMTIGSKEPLPWESLRSLTLDVSGDWGDEGADFFHLLPRSLKSLCFSLPDPDDLPDGVSLPEPISHPSLSTLKIDSAFWPVNWTLKSLGALPRLTDVTLNFRGCYSEYDQGPSDSDEPYSLPNVRTLKLQNLYWPQRDKTRILRFLSTPSLTELEITFETDGEVDATNVPEMASDIAQFARISSSLPNLRSLRLQGMTITAKGLNPILRAFPSVTHLILSAISIHGKSLGFNRDVLPQLQVFEFLDFPDNENEAIDLERVLEFIKARGPNSSNRGNTAAIHKATISIAKCFHQSRYPKDHWCEVMKKEGVDFSFERP